MPDFHALSLTTNLSVLAVSAAIVWIAGTRLARYADDLAGATGMGRALAGFLFLGGITSLPELSSTLTASFEGYGTLAISALLGSVCINLLLLAFADALLGRNALTAVVAHPATLLQGLLGILLLGVVVAGIVVGEVEILGVGLWAASLVPLFVFSVWLSSRQENEPSWIAANRSPLTPVDAIEGETKSDSSTVALTPLISLIVLVGAVILVAGVVLAETGAAVAEQTGLGNGLVGFILIGFTTSLPEISSMIGAARLRRYELAIGDIFGTNLFDLLIIPIADIVFVGPILDAAGPFEILAATLGIVLTAIYVIGLLNRRNATLLRFGYDSLVAIVVFAGGIVLLNVVRPL